MAAHSTWPASAAKRNIMCSASFGACLKFADERKSSAFAAEGTAAHAFAEEYLKGGALPEEHVGGTWSADGHTGPVTEEMADFIRDYTDAVDALRALGFEVELEKRVSPGWLWPDGKGPVELFGTADCVAYNPDTAKLVVVDLKFGRGIPVEADENPQLLYYALGAMYPIAMQVQAKNPGRVAISEVEIMVVQPRAPHPKGPVRSKTYTAQWVTDWGVNVLRPAVERSVSGKDVEFASGDWCRFCPALLECPRVQEARQNAAAGAFDDLAPEDDPARIAALLDEAELLERVAARVMDTAYAAAIKGAAIPGWKMVPKRAVRSWRDAAAAEELLVEKGLDASVFMEPRALRSPAQVLGNRVVKADKALVADLNDFVASISSGTTLVRDSDPRTPVPGRPAASDVFDD